MRYLQALDFFTHPVGHEFGTGEVGIRQDCRELLAAIAAYQVNWPVQDGEQSLSNLLQTDVPGDMAIGIVVILEVVDIEDDHR